MLCDICARCSGCGSSDWSLLALCVLEGLQIRVVCSRGLGGFGLLIEFCFCLSRMVLGIKQLCAVDLDT